MRIANLFRSRKSPSSPIMAHYLIGYEPTDPNSPQLAEHLAEIGAQRVSACEWVLKYEAGKTLELYRTIGGFDVHGFFLQQLSSKHDWDNIMLSADVFFDLLKSS